METPDLAWVVETSVPIRSLEFGAYLSQLRTDVLPHIRQLQADGRLRWFSFLIHPASQLEGRDAADSAPIIHLRLEPATSLDLSEFIDSLPPHFEAPTVRALSEIDGVDPSCCAMAIGHTLGTWLASRSKWVLSLVEDHQATPSLQQVVQFLHYITNAAALGGSCMLVPEACSPSRRGASALSSSLKCNVCAPAYLAS